MSRVSSRNWNSRGWATRCAPGSTGPNQPITAEQVSSAFRWRHQSDRREDRHDSAGTDAEAGTAPASGHRSPDAQRHRFLPRPRNTSCGAGLFSEDAAGSGPRRRSCLPLRLFIAADGATNVRPVTETWPLENAHRLPKSGQILVAKVPQSCHRPCRWWIHRRRSRRAHSVPLRPQRRRHP